MRIALPLKLLATSALLTLAAASQAALITYNTQAAFLAAVSAPGIDGFDDISTSGITASPINRTAGPYGYRGSVFDAFFAVGSPADPWLSTNLATDVILLDNFSAGVNAIGGMFFGTAGNGTYLSGDILVVATDTDGVLSQTLFSPSTSSFYGFVSTTSLLSLRVAALRPRGLLWPTLDKLTLAQRVTEPGTMALTALGLVAVAAARRRAAC